MLSKNINEDVCKVKLPSATVYIWKQITDRQGQCLSVSSRWSRVVPTHSILLAVRESSRVYLRHLPTATTPSPVSRMSSSLRYRGLRVVLYLGYGSNIKVEFSCWVIAVSETRETPAEPVRYVCQLPCQHSKFTKKIDFFQNICLFTLCITNESYNPLQYFISINLELK